MASVAAAYPASLPQAGTVPPSQDPFYHDAPLNLADLQHGDIIDYRSVTLPKLLPANQAWQIKFRSENTFGKPTYAITTLVIPELADKSKLVTVAPWEDASYQNCAPSYYMTSNADLGNDLIDFAEFYSMFLSRGWVLNYPDHQGPNNSFAAGHLEGKITLDSIRAIKKFTDVSKMPENFQNAMYGYSGGTIPVGWAAELQPTYAPELNISIAVTGGNIVNLRSLFGHINGGLFAGYIVPGILGLASEYTNVWDVLWKFFRPEAAGKFLKGLSMCMIGDLTTYWFDDIIKKFFNSDKFLDDPTISQVLQDTSQGHNIPKIPRFIFQGVLDEIQDIKSVDAFVESYCAGGADVEYERSALTGHVLLLVTRAPLALSKIDMAFRGIVPKGCNVPASIHDAAPSAAEIWNATLQDAALLRLPLNQSMIMANAPK